MTFITNVKDVIKTLRLRFSGNWNSINKTPPNEFRLEVMDSEGQTAFAFATYYPFKIEKRPGDENKPWGLRGTVVPCNLHWDGGWLIDASDLNIPKIGNIKYWRVRPANY